MQTMLLVALGAAVGANARYLLSSWAVKHWGAAFPYGTLLINVLGSLGIGLVMGLLAQRPDAGPAWQPMLVTGFLGGFTTFSTFSFETYRLITAGQLGQATLYAAGSVALGLAAVFAGLWLARGLG
ncbi:MAG TPA: fluoride efflux transporter CrcB [Roseiflexaceae bacterium]|nr:fluoride efflux transporter CrcB [Roseiflexaceae bacterium]